MEPVRLLYSDPDSLRVLSLDIPGIQGAEPIWSGPGGSANGRGYSLWYREELASDETEAPDALYLYPNPARDYCTIRAEEFSGTLKVHAYTASGTNLGDVATLTGGSRPVVEQIWDVSHLAPGLYHVVVEQMDSGKTLGRYRLTLMVVR